MHLLNLCRCRDQCIISLFVQRLGRVRPFSTCYRRHTTATRKKNDFIRLRVLCVFFCYPPHGTKFDLGS